MPDTAALPSHALPIRKAAELLGVSAHTLRYYEREGLLDVPRTEGGERLYGERELAALRFLFHLRGVGVNMAGLREYVALVRQGDGTVTVRRELLVRHEQAVNAQLETLATALHAIRRKIEKYDQ
ncbi:MerR family transcriptional regulator [Deinococcus arenicola]|uniref:MerR family transcriptional regulator n=1 Tax=Deinococcus arenicola TaxID=2994950 RepID=A0ABU4DN39_9DEIO|nr:MerR family transcriptional regulator [Deinococcus sp. ZS9-10]MDV6373857.1 MerR family transcriptional regulator [Deinococcus sp. ZS9-10]